jgi:hypothetical protein
MFAASTAAVFAQAGHVPAPLASVQWEKQMPAAFSAAPVGCACLHVNDQRQHGRLARPLVSYITYKNGCTAFVVIVASKDNQPHGGHGCMPGAISTRSCQWAEIRLLPGQEARFDIAGFFNSAVKTISCER